MNPTPVDQKADFGDVGSSLAACGLEEAIQLNIFSGEQVEPSVGNALEVKLVSIKAGEVRITPDVGTDGIVVVAASSSLDVHPNIPICTSGTIQARPGVVASVFIVAVVNLGDKVIYTSNAGGGDVLVGVRVDREFRGIAKREAERYQQREHHEENSSLHHLVVGVVVRSGRNGGLLLLF